MKDADWAPLRAALLRWEEAGRVADFWLRDDDAVEPTLALERLLRLAERHAVPVVLAVIPAGAGAALAGRLAAAPLVTVALHGWAHHNHASGREKKQEFGPHRPADVMLRELREGSARLGRLFPKSFLPLFVPPWNRIDPALVTRLSEAGLQGLSAFGPGRETALPVLNTNVDIIDWHGTRGGREPAVLIAEIVAELDRVEQSGTGAVGILTHHLVHDPKAWDFLDGLFEETADHAGCRWRSAADLLPGVL